MMECSKISNPRPPYFNDTYSLTSGHIRDLNVADYVVLGLVVFISCSIGIFNSWNDKDEMELENFLSADRQMSPILVGFSMSAAYLSSSGVIGAPGMIYSYGWMYFMNPVGFLLLCMCMAYIYLPILYRLDVITAYEYLELRFSKTLRTVVSALFAVQTAVYLATTITGPTSALVQVTGINRWAGLFISFSVCVLYTLSGGMRAVLWTDVFQIFVMVLGLLVLLVVSMVDVGSWGEVKQANIRGGRYIVNDWTLSFGHGFTWWTSTFGFLLTFLSRFGCYQVQLQRALTCNTLKQAQTAVWVNLPIVTIVFTLGCFVGTYTSALYENCDPIKTRVIFHHSQIAALYANDVLIKYPGLAGLYYAAVAAAGMSTFSSHIYSVAGAVFQDCIQNNVPFYIGDRMVRKIMQGLTSILVVSSIGLAFLMTYFGPRSSLAFWMRTVYLHSGGPILGVFTLGMFFPWANTAGAYSGLFGSLAIVYATSYFSSKSNKPKSPIKFCRNNCPLHLLKKGKKVVSKIVSTATVTIPPDLFETTNSNMDGTNITTTIESITMRSNNMTSPAPVPPPRRRSSKPYDVYVAYLWYAVISCFSCIIIGLIVSFLTGPRLPEMMSPRLQVLLSNLRPFTYLPEEWRIRLRCGVPYRRPGSDSLSMWPPSSGFPSAAASFRSSHIGLAPAPIPDAPLHNITEKDFPSEQRMGQESSSAFK